MEFFFLNTNFDGSNIEKPLFGFLDSSLSLLTSKRNIRTALIQLEENVAILEDSYYGFTPEKSEYLKFYQLASIYRDEHYSEGKGKYDVLEVKFKQNISYVVYQRTKYNLLGVLSELGGIFNSFYLIGFGFTLMFSYNLMMSSLIRKMYFFKARFDSEIKKKKKPPKKSKKDEEKKE